MGNVERYLEVASTFDHGLYLGSSDPVGVDTQRIPLVTDISPGDGIKLLWLVRYVERSRYLISTNNMKELLSKS